MTSNIKFYFKIMTSSGVPIYRQLIDQVKTHIAVGSIAEGVFLPSVRVVAQELEINPMTVSKAYSQLEKEKVVESIRGKGMRVRNRGKSKKSLDKRENDIEPLLKDVVQRAQQLSLSSKRFIKLVEKVWEEQKNVK